MKAPSRLWPGAFIVYYSNPDASFKTAWNHALAVYRAIAARASRTKVDAPCTMTHQGGACRSRRRL